MANTPLCRLFPLLVDSFGTLNIARTQSAITHTAMKTKRSYAKISFVNYSEFVLAASRLTSVEMGMIHIHKHKKEHIYGKWLLLSNPLHIFLLNAAFYVQ